MWFAVLLLTGVLAAPGLSAQRPVPSGGQWQIDRRHHSDRLQLNIRYGEVMKTLSPQMRVALRNEQRTWLKGRDPACKRAAKASEGGSIWPLVFNACLEKSTRKRTAELDRWKGREQ